MGKLLKIACWKSQDLLLTYHICMIQRKATEKNTEGMEKAARSSQCSTYSSAAGRLSSTGSQLVVPSPIPFLFSSAVNGVGGEQQPADTAALFTASSCGLH